jgi:hypothetical protein
MSDDKKIIRISFDHNEWEAVNILMEELRIGTPQKLVRFLLSTQVSKIQTAERWKGGSNKPRKLTAIERRRAFEQLPDEEILAKILPHLQREFAHYTNPTFRIEPLANSTDKLIRVIAPENGFPEPNGDAVPLSGMLNNWLKEKLIEL